MVALEIVDVASEWPTYVYEVAILLRCSGIPLYVFASFSYFYFY